MIYLTPEQLKRWNEAKKTLQRQRWEKVALAAAKQSQRSALSVIEPIQDIKEVLSKAQEFDLKLIPKKKENHHLDYNFIPPRRRNFFLCQVKKTKNYLYNYVLKCLTNFSSEHYTDHQIRARSSHLASVIDIVSDTNTSPRIIRV